MSASRRHCEVRYAAGKFKVIDLGSKNGTYVNGVRVTERELHNGDLISVADSAIRFEDN